MILPKIEILDEKDKRLREVSKEVVFPISLRDKNMITDMITYLKMSQIEEEQVKYDLRAGWGLSIVQLGILKRIFVIVDEVSDGVFKEYIMINPTIKSVSEELIYVSEGEGCLSVNRKMEGVVPRHARITVDAYDMNGELFSVRVREELSIAFQHEMDHLNGILFIDRIDRNQPFKNVDKMREI